MLNLKMLSEHITNYGLWEKRLADFSEVEIKQLGDAFFSSPDENIPANGWQKPFINTHGDIVVPSDSHPDYHWWTTTGKTAKAIIDEMVPEDQKEMYYKKYLPHTGNMERNRGDA